MIVSEILAELCCKGNIEAGSGGVTVRFVPIPQGLKPIILAELFKKCGRWRGEAPQRPLVCRSVTLAFHEIVREFLVFVPGVIVKAGDIDGLDILLLEIT